MIKNFVYLDVEKMYSLSSQLFEGVTEYIIQESNTESENIESQKGPIGSGKILGDILRHSDKTTDKRFLNDYSYTLFEKKLIGDDRVVKLNSESTLSDIRESLKIKSFIKVRAKAIFNDIKSINNTLENFNDIGKALAHISNFEKINQVREQLEKFKTTTRNKNQRSKLQSQFKGLTNLDKLAKESGLHQDQTFLKNMSLLLKFGFQDQFEVQMEISGEIASANLKRDYLREEENLIIRKYSRQTEIEFVLFGIVTQHERDDIEISSEDNDFPSMKEALMNLVSHLTKMESTFTGRLTNEIIIDPIALYTEL